MAAEEFQLEPLVPGGTLDSSGRCILSYMVCGSRFDVESRYTLLRPIGQGAYGVVCSARDESTGTLVAIKKINRVFDHVTDAKRALREVQLLRHFRHENVVQIRDILRPARKADFSDLYLVFELLDTDLFQITSSPQPLGTEHVQYFVYQILRGLKYVHSANVLHRDLKPGNLLLNANCDLKIADFGLARTSIPEQNHAGFLTEYVATRWYRAPEILLSWQAYSQAIDVWSVGCILAELVGRKPLFPGRDYVQQLNLICAILGSPSKLDLAGIESNRARDFVLSLPPRDKVPFSLLYPQAPPECVDLLERMIVFNPAQRIGVDEALAHPFFAHLHDPSDEPECERPAEDFELEGAQLTRGVLRDRLWEHVVAFHPELAAEEQQEPAGPGGAAEPELAGPPQNPDLAFLGAPAQLDAPGEVDSGQFGAEDMDET